MDILECERRRMKLKRNIVSSKKKNSDKIGKYVNNLITRLLLSLIVFFGVVIVSNMSEKYEKFIYEVVLKENMSFSKITNIYEKYFGSVLPFDDLVGDEQTVFNETFQYESIINYKDGYEVEVGENYLIPVINSGIVVFVGEKEGLGNTVIVQGIDEVDYWYSNVTNIHPSLYDYVSKGELLGSSDGVKMYLTFKKGNEYLEYDEVIG